MDVKKITLQREQTRLQTPEKIRLTPNSDGRMWKMYTRLNEMSDNGRLQLNKEYDELCPFTEHGEQLQVPVSLSRVVSPHSGDIRCHCFQAALKGVEKVWPNKTQNRSPNLISEMQDRRFLNEIHHKMEENRQYQYPMSTVVVRWHYTPDDYACDPLTILEDLIAKCGPVTSSSPVSTNSMVVIFDTLSSSCVAVTLRGRIWQAHWWHKSMHSTFVKKSKRFPGVEIKRNKFLQHQ